MVHPPVTTKTSASLVVQVLGRHNREGIHTILDRDGHAAVKVRRDVAVQEPRPRVVAVVPDRQPGRLVDRGGRGKGVPPGRRGEVEARRLGLHRLGDGRPGEGPRARPDEEHLAAVLVHRVLRLGPGRGDEHEVDPGVVERGDGDVVAYEGLRVEEEGVLHLVRQGVDRVVQGPEVCLSRHDHAEDKGVVRGRGDRYWRVRPHQSLREDPDVRCGAGSNVVDVCYGWRVWRWLAGLVV